MIIIINLFASVEVKISEKPSCISIITYSLCSQPILSRQDFCKAFIKNIVYLSLYKENRRGKKVFNDLNRWHLQKFFRFIEFFIFCVSEEKQMRSIILFKEKQKLMILILNKIRNGHRLSQKCILTSVDFFNIYVLKNLL